MAERFAEHSASVVLAGRKQPRLDAAASAFRAAGGVAETAALDVREYTEVADALRKTRERFGEIDILLCAAAGNFPAPVTGMSAIGFKAVIDIDLLGTFNTCRAAYEFLRKPGASIVSISASHATTPIEDWLARAKHSTPAQRPVNAGARFSTKCATPSLKSSHCRLARISSVAVSSACPSVWNMAS
jgi:NAD(P)-dependent dehydrogenase (short-subunit alcohol dehydrogenase family)